VQPNGSFAIRAPDGFKIIKRCPKFRRVNLPECRCKGSDSNFAKLEFINSDAIQKNNVYKFEIEITNPIDNPASDENFWRFDTVRPDGVEKDTVRYDGFLVYPKSLSSFTISPTSRRSGVHPITIRFKPEEDIPFDDYIRVRAPLGFVWQHENLQFTSDKADTDTATDIEFRESEISFNEDYRTIVMRLSKNADAGFEYGFRANCLIPEITPTPNRWWIEQYSQTGNAPPNHWNYLASAGGDGFKSQFLYDAYVVPYNRVKAPRENPVQVSFATTTATKTVTTDGGTVTTLAKLLLSAPEDFSYNCPLIPTGMIPQGTIALPPAECVVNNNVGERRHLWLEFREAPWGLEADTRYIFTIDLTNAENDVNQATNFFHLKTYSDDVFIEGVTIDGYALADQMENTRIVLGEPGEDRRVGAEKNTIIFAIGTTEDMPIGSILELKAPTGYIFDRDCVNKVADGQLQGVSTLTFPSIASCENQEAYGPYANVAKITVSEPWAKGIYTLAVTLENPVSTPEENNFAAIVFQPDGKTATMAEAFISGFKIQELTGVGLFPFNPANAFPGEAAPNPVIFSFMLNTRLPERMAFDKEGGLLIIVPPRGFYFPTVCRKFQTKVNLKTDIGRVKKMNPDTSCVTKEMELTRVEYRKDNQKYLVEFPELRILDDIQLEHEDETKGSADRITITFMSPDGPASRSRTRLGYVLSNIHIDGLTTYKTDDNEPDLEWQQHMDDAELNIHQYLEVLDAMDVSIWLTFKGPSVVLTIPPKTWLEVNKQYAFQLLVENPAEKFVTTDVPKWHWTLETRRALGTYDTRIDLNYRIPSFPIHQRIRFFYLDSLSKTGRKPTTLRIAFNLFYDLPPQANITITSPEEVSLTKGPCALDAEVEHLFTDDMIKDVGVRPEWLLCSVVDENMIVLTNSLDLRGGRNLGNGPTYQFFVSNAINPESTPKLNLWRIRADTLVPEGQEIWALEGYEIFPELSEATVVAENPALGLYSNFTFHIKTVSRVPEGGSVRIVAPSKEYYFGPKLGTSNRDDLDVTPAPSPCDPSFDPSCEEIVFPGEDEVIKCEGMIPVTDKKHECPLIFAPCVEEQERLEFEDNQAESVTAALVNLRLIAQKACEGLKKKCEDYGKIFQCDSKPGELELTLDEFTSIPEGQVFEFVVKGYNQRKRLINESDGTEIQAFWHFATQNGDSAKTVLDEKKGVPGFDLLGVINVLSIIPSKSKVSTNENKVTVTLQLSTKVPPRARLKITHPEAFIQDTSQAGRLPAVETGENIPRKSQKDHKDNIITVDLLEESFQRGINLEITIILVNPGISPPGADNIWRFETFTAPLSSDDEIDEADMTRLDCNFDAEGFRIYGEFRAAQVLPAILSPSVKNLVAIYFVLESDLIWMENESIFMRIWLPPGFVPDLYCGGNENFKLSWNPADFMGSKTSFPKDKEMTLLPVATECMACREASDKCPMKEGDTNYILLTLQKTLELGIDYAFQFSLKNPDENPAVGTNDFRFETLREKVVLHFRPRVPGFVLEEIRMATITPGDTSKNSINRVTLSIMSSKIIPGGSSIQIYAPRGFTFICNGFQTIGLAQTTTCSKQEELATFAMDSQDGKDPNFPFKIIIDIVNPEFTPQPNEWRFSIVSVFGLHVDVRRHIPGFFVTGPIHGAKLDPSFKFLGQWNLVSFVFVPSTIMNQADTYNEIEITAPKNYLFPQECKRFSLKLTEHAPQAIGDTAPPPPPPRTYFKNGKPVPFPPENTICYGFGNNSMVVRFPPGAGFLQNNYTLEAEIHNPKENPFPNCTALAHNPKNYWKMNTRVNDGYGLILVDTNNTIPGFCLEKLMNVKDTGEDELEGEEGASGEGAAIPGLDSDFDEFDDVAPTTARASSTHVLIPLLLILFYHFPWRLHTLNRHRMEEAGVKI